MRRFLPLIPLVLLAACSRTPEPAAETSVLLVTYGFAPASAFGTASANAPSMTPVFDSLAAAGGRGTASEASSDVAVSARRLLADGALPAALRGKGYRLGAFVADPALADVAALFDAKAVPDAAAVESNRLARAGADLVPRPFEHPSYLGFLRGEAVVNASLAWLAREAGVPEEEVKPALGRAPRAAAKKDGGTPSRKEPTAGCLKKPVLLWVHLADPVFQDSPESTRAGGGAAPRAKVEVAYMDLQLGRLVAFLSEHGLRERMEIAVVGLTADGEGGEVPVLLPPENPGFAVGGAAEPESLSDEERTRRALERRLRRPDPKDEALAADCGAYADAHAESAEARCWQGVALARAKKFDEALAAQKKAFDLEPGSAFRMSNLGLAYLETGDVAKAIDQLENAYLAEPWNGLYKSNLAAVLLKVGMAFTEQKQYKDAMACLSRVTLLQPRNPLGYLAQGRLHEKMGQPKLAEGLYRKALEIQPKFKPAQAALDALAHPQPPAAAPEGANP